MGLIRLHNHNLNKGIEPGAELKIIIETQLYCNRSSKHYSWKSEESHWYIFVMHFFSAWPEQRSALARLSQCKGEIDSVQRRDWLSTRARWTLCKGEINSVHCRDWLSTLARLTKCEGEIASQCLGKINSVRGREWLSTQADNVDSEPNRDWLS